MFRNAPLVSRLVLVLMTLGLCLPLCAQGFGPEMFTLPSTFGMSTPISTRQLSMGTVQSCIEDALFVNPAFGPLQRDPNAGARVAVTALERGPDVTSGLGHYVLPLRPNETALGLTVLVLSSSNGDMTLPEIGPASIGLAERAFVVNYGRRLAERLTAGLSILGYQETEVTLAPPVGRMLLDVRAKADVGLSFGSAWEWAPDSFLGAMYSWSRIGVDTEGAMVPAPMSNRFTGDQFLVGVSRRFGPQWLGAVEYQHCGMHASGFEDSGSDIWSFGAEYTPGGPWSFRAGLADESPTFGFGFNNGAWRADYAFIKDWRDGDLGELFGGSRTHSIQVIGTW